MLRHGILFRRNKITEIAGHIKLRFSKFVREDKTKYFFRFLVVEPLRGLGLGGGV